MSARSRSGRRRSRPAKLALPLDRLEATIDAAGFTALPVTAAHALEVRHLPPLHRDPFDRLLIARARHERLTLVTCDAAIRRYPAATLWDQAEGSPMAHAEEHGLLPARRRSSASAAKRGDATLS